MGFKKLLKHQIITDGSMTGTSTLTSASQEISNLDTVGLQYSWTGSAVGTFSVEVSIDGSNWEPLVFSPVLTQPAGTAGSHMIWITINVTQVYLRAKYVNTSSTGTLQVWFCGKDLN